MIQAARSKEVSATWLVDDIREWAMREENAGELFDLIISCSALHWVPNHGILFPQLLKKVAPGGVLAVHMPACGSVAHRIMNEMASTPHWLPYFPPDEARGWKSHSLEFYYETLVRDVVRIDLWASEYLHIMPNHRGIVEWYKGTGLRPYLDCLQRKDLQDEFLREFESRLVPLFPQAGGRGVPFPFRRLFIVSSM